MLRLKFGVPILNRESTMEHNKVSYSCNRISYNSMIRCSNVGAYYFISCLYPKGTWVVATIRSSCSIGWVLPPLRETWIMFIYYSYI